MTASWCPVAAGLVTRVHDSDDLDTFTHNLFWIPIALVRTPAWAGPIYRVSEGNHCIHTARILNLPWLAASVSYQAILPPWKMTDLIDNHPTKAELSQPGEQRLSNRAAHVAGLIRRGIFDGTLSHDGPESILHCRYLPASWLLREAREATAMNAAYESRYPGALASLGIPATIGTDILAWTQLSALTNYVSVQCDTRSHELS